MTPTLFLVCLAFCNAFAGGVALGLCLATSARTWWRALGLVVVEMVAVAAVASVIVRVTDPGPPTVPAPTGFPVSPSRL